MALFQQGSFLYDPKNDTPETVARKRALVAAIMGDMGPRTARNAGEGIGNALASIGQGIQVNVLNRRADAAAQAGQDSANAAWNPLLASMGGQQFPAAPGASDAGASDAASERVSKAFAPLGDSQNAFVSGLMPAAIEASKRTGVDPRIIVAQAAQETGWGKHAPGNNYFGIKSHGQGGGQNLATTEYVNGKPVRMNDSFRGYASPADSVAGYADFLLKNPRYKPMMQAQGLDAQLQALGASGYATDPNYANSVGAIARSLNLPGNAAGATEAMATGQPIPAAPTQVASLDPSAGMATPETAPDVANITPRDPSLSNPVAGQPLADDAKTNRIMSTMMSPQPMGGSPMPMQGMPSPQQVAQAQPNPGPANLPVMAGGSADAIQPGQQSGPSLQMLLQAAQNPWLNDTQKAVVQMMLKQKMDEQDPMRSLEMQYKQAQISKLTDPNARDKFGNSVIWGQDADGNWVAMQPSSGGGLIPAKTPDGIKLSPPGIGQMNLGTSFGVRDRNGNVVNTVPIDNAGKASETKLGENRGNLQASLPSDMLNTNQAISDIDALINNPGLDSIVGGVDQYRPSWMLGDQGRDAAARLNQIKGKTFLQAYATLKGGGSITEVEGKKAEDAIGRLDRAQDEKTFRAALSDLRDVIAQGQRVLLQKAGIPQDQWGQYLNGGDTGSSGTKRLKFNPATGELE